MRVVRRIIFMIALTILTIGALSVAYADSEGISSIKAGDHIGKNDQFLVVSNKSYQLAPNVTEYELFMNNDDLTAQQASHVIEVKPGSESDIVVGNGKYDIEGAKSGKWSKTKSTEQADAFVSKTKKNVVGLINADGFNTANGAPAGVLVMDSNLIKTSGYNVFYIDQDGKAHIEENAANISDWSKVKEAVGGCGMLVKDGAVVQAPNENDITNPRTAIGIQDDGTVIMYEIDGRMAPYSDGVVMEELAYIMKDLGCVNAVNLDGGGSSTMASKREGESTITMRNRGADGTERPVSDSLLVVSNVTASGVFDHVVITDSNQVLKPGEHEKDIYTPSTDTKDTVIDFNAISVDSSGKEVTMPNDLKWAVSEENKGIITQDGKFTAAKNAIGTVKIQQKLGDTVVGEKTITLAWPDKLSFTNNSISMDYNKSSDLSFKPTYKGQEIVYKNGDFEWKLNASSYKHTALVDPKSNNGKGDFSMTITPDIIGKETKLVDYYAWGTGLTYTSTYKVTSIDDTNESGTGKKASVSYVSSGGAIGEKKPENDPQTFTFSLGSFENNKFISDAENSVRGKISVSLTSNKDIKNSVDLVVGMDPYMLMDFEYHTNKDGTVTKANDYWTYKVGPSSVTNKSTELTSQEVKDNRLWYRDTTGKIGSSFTDSSKYSLSLLSGENVRFGNHALRLKYDVSSIDAGTSTSADFGFSGDLYVKTVQPTAIGMWINVPDECKNDDTQIKAVLKGAANEAGLATSYMILDEDGNITYKDGYQLTGTAAYVNYTSTDENGNTLKTLSDWAGKGWTYVTADISAYQMPVDVCRAYTVRLTSPPNGVKSKGYVDIDNVQFIYGTNTEDTKAPNIETVQVTSQNGISLNGEPTLTSGKNIDLEATVNDKHDDFNYDTGVDYSSIKFLVDGTDFTDKTEQFSISDNHLTLQSLDLKNGEHTVSISLKDLNGNETKKSYSFTVNDDKGENGLLKVEAQEDAPALGQDYKINITNTDQVQPVESASVTIKIPAEYIANKSYSVTAGDGYTVESTSDSKENTITIDVTKKQDAEAFVQNIAVLHLQIPKYAKKGDTVSYQVVKGEYDTASERASFSQKERTAEITAAYTLTAGEAVAGYPVMLTVKDNDGNPVKDADIYLVGTPDEKIGTTGDDGTLIYTLTNSGNTAVYASTDTGMSWYCSFIVNTVGTFQDSKPFGLQDNAVSDPKTSRSITWLSSLGDRDKWIFSYSENSDMADASTAKIYQKTLSFTEASGGVSYLTNAVNLTGLESGKTYYYQIRKDGEIGANIHSFQTAGNDASVKFAVLGDIQTDDTSNLNKAVETINSGSYQLAVQTGDAIDNPTRFSNWSNLLSALNEDTLGGTPVVHVMGNHEYDGNSSGSIAGTVFDLPQASSGSVWSTEYGDVFVGVINCPMTQEDDLSAALDKLKTPASKSDCIWKVLVMHKPVFPTETSVSLASKKDITDAIEDAGFEFVFTGDNHSYARTYPLLDGEKKSEDSRTGTVYFISGDLSSKTNEFHTSDYFAKAMEHADYEGLWLSVTADNEKFKVEAIDKDGSVIDTYTKKRTDCELGKHTFDTEKSKYDLEKKTITCSICGESIPVEETTATGRFKTTDGQEVMLASGNLKKGWFASGEQTDNEETADMCYAGSDGALQKVTVKWTGDCITQGKYVYSAQGADDYYGDPIFPQGHKWDENHVCQRCGTKGIDITKADVQVENAVSGDYPEVTVTYDGEVLGHQKVPTNWDEYDYFITYGPRTIGTHTLTVTGRRDYYGEITKSYDVIPATPKNLKADKIEKSSMNVTWDSAGDSLDYILEISKDSGKSWEETYSGSNLNTAIKDVSASKSYQLRVRASKTIDGKDYVSAWSDVQTAGYVPAPSSGDGGSASSATALTVTYTDGVTEEEIFPDQVNKDLKPGDATPAFIGTPKRSGYEFDGWDPDVADKVTEDVVYNAKWTKSKGVTEADGSVTIKNDDGSTLNTKTEDDGTIVETYRDADGKIVRIVTTSPMSVDEETGVKTQTVTTDDRVSGKITAEETVTQKDGSSSVTTSVSGNGSTVSRQIVKNDASGNTVSTEAVAIGDIVTIGSIVYKIKNIDKKSVTALHPTKSGKKLSKLTVRDTIAKAGIKFRVDTIASKGFQKSKKLKTIIIGKNVKSIGSRAFYKSMKMKSVKFKGKSVKKAGKYAFRGISKKAVFYAPSSKKNSYKKLLIRSKSWKSTMKVKTVRK